MGLSLWIFFSVFVLNSFFDWKKTKTKKNTGSLRSILEFPAESPSRLRPWHLSYFLWVLNLIASFPLNILFFLFNGIWWVEQKYCQKRCLIGTTSTVFKWAASTRSDARFAWMKSPRLLLPKSRNALTSTASRAFFASFQDVFSSKRTFGQKGFVLF